MLIYNKMGNIYLYIVIFAGFIVNAIMLFIAINKLSLTMEHRMTKLETVYETIKRDIEHFFRKIEQKEK